jgi:hypothetical protein
VTLRFPAILLVAAALVDGSSSVTLGHAGFSDSTIVHV